MVPCFAVIPFQVCFKDAVFSFNPRMIRGLYYNMPLVLLNTVLTV